MGVTGLWRLIEPAGKPVPVETLENKVLAVDISIWLHQMVKGYQDAKGAPLPNAHLMGLFQRVCKLLYFRIKPVFVFDGGFPDLKRETIAKRQDNKSKYNSESERIRRELALILSKRTAIGSLLGKQISPKKAAATNAINDEDLFKLPEIPQEQEIESESEDESSSSSSLDVHSIDIESEKFKHLSSKEKLDLLVEMKETRKMNSWGKIHELPKKSDNFSDFQMQRLLKRRKVQACLEETEKEMGESGMSLNELESLLNEEGIDTNLEALPTRRIAADNTTRYLLISDVKQALADAKKKEEEAENKNKGISNKLVENEGTGENTPHDELEEDLQKAIKMSMECVEDSNVSACTSKADDSWTSNFSDSDAYEIDSEEEDGYVQPEEMASAKAYILQYSDFTHNMINKIVSKQSIPKSKDKVPHINQILEELNNEKTIIEDNIELSSSEDDNPKECVLSENVNDKSNNALVHLDVTDDDQELTNNEAEESVVCIEKNTHESVILLDSTLEEDPLISTNQKNVNETPRIDSQISAECVKVIQNKDINVKNNESNENTNLKELIFKKSDSESSDDDFEEVTDTDHTNKNTVVELMLNVGKAPEDDIFADIFEDVKYTPDKREDKVISNLDNSATYVISNTEDDMALQVCRNTGNDLQTINNQPEKKGLDTKTNTDKFTAPINTSIINHSLVKNKVLESDTSSSEMVKVIKPSLFSDSLSLNKNIATDPSTASTKEKSVESEAADSNNERIALEKAVTNNMNNKIRTPISAEILNTMDEEMQTVEQNLVQEKGRMDRIGRNITEQMTKEAQELLQIFGIPYIIAPMEAEAQCAFLETVKLTDGTITDDSDIWLFGGRTVYKNFFNQKKHVLQFLAERIERSFNLSREKLILLALLVGSDYTTGVNGVGPVTALEILASFPLNKKAMNETSEQAKYSSIVSGLQEFKQWIRAGRRTSNTNLKKKLKNVNVTDDFPSVRVVQAYLEPNVETNEESFTWGNLDITVLRDYAKTKFGWSQHKLDEIVKPVLQRLSDAKKQKSVRDYFQRKIDFQCLEEQMSKRVKAAVQKMNPDAPGDQNVPETDKVKSKPTRKRKNNKSNKESISVNSNEEAGPSKPKSTKTETDILANAGVRVVSEIQDGKSSVEIKINKIDRFQEMIPQREKDKQSLLQNKMKAIEIFRKTNLVRKKSKVKRRVNLPKEKAELSESSDSN